MKVVVALDSFKGTLSSPRACGIVADAIREKVAGAVVVIKPMADGGEGTARAMMEAGEGEWIAKTVTGPLEDMQVEAGFAWFEEDKTALVEMAAVSGLELLRPEQLNPMKTTTYGTGELMRAACEYGAQKILLAVGGSATVDGGVGAAMALGWEFLDANGKPVAFGGGGLLQIKTIVGPKGLQLPAVEVLCDCDNPLCGEHGAARIYGPQKGATAEMVEELEEGLAYLAEVVKRHLGKNIKDVPGAGAAGGLAAGAIAFMGGTIVSGVDVVMSRSGLEDAMAVADWVITGEGSFDFQSLRGKVVCGICRLAREANVKVAVISGQVKVDREEIERFGIAEVLACRKEVMSLEYALENSRALLYDAASELSERLTAKE